MSPIPKIKLYGSETCHKTQYYKALLGKKGMEYTFLDVVKNERFANELKGLYTSGRLNFPTLTIGKKKLRNPSDSQLNKWIEKLK